MSRRAHITEAEVRSVAALARLELSEAEVATFGAQLDAIVDYVGELAALDEEARAVEGTSHGGALSCPRRPDEARPSPVAHERLLDQAARHDGGFFIVPRIIE